MRIFQKKTSHVDFNDNKSPQVYKDPTQWSEAADARRHALRSWLSDPHQGMLSCTRCNVLVCLHAKCSCKAPHERVLFELRSHANPQDVDRRFFCCECKTSLAIFLEGMHKSMPGDVLLAHDLCTLCGDHKAKESLSIGPSPDQMRTVQEICESCKDNVFAWMSDIDLKAIEGEAGVAKSRVRTVSENLTARLRMLGQD